MKFIKPSILLICLFLSSQANTQAKLDHLGLIAELTYMKNVSENYITASITDSAFSRQEKAAAVLNYNQIKLLLDQLTLEMIADMDQYNSLKLFRKLDQRLMKSTAQNLKPRHRDNAKLKTFIRNFQFAYETFEDKVSSNFTPLASRGAEGTSKYLSYFAKLLPCASGEVLGLANAVNAAVKDAGLLKEKKVVKIAGMLEGLRLKHTSEILKELKNTK